MRDELHVIELPEFLQRGEDEQLITDAELETWDFEYGGEDD